MSEERRDTLRSSARMQAELRDRLKKSRLKAREVEEDPYHVLGAEKIEGAPHVSEDLVEKYSLFKSHFKPTDELVYHPCGSYDVSPSSVFKHVVYADIADAPMESLRKAGFDTHTASALEYDPGEVDVLILLNPQIRPEIPASHVQSGGYVLCNDYHGTASELHGDAAFELVGVIPQQGKRHIDTENLGDYWMEIETEEEFKASPFNWGTANYAIAKKAVEDLAGKTDNILEEYKKLIERARKDQAEENARLRAKYPDQEGLLSDEGQDTFIIEHEGRHYGLDAKLPRKKGTADAIFIFRKK